jgi:superoxide reductase
MEKSRFFICEKCGNIIGEIHSSGVPMSCCGQEMKELIPNTVDAAVEKHLPVVSIDENNVSIQIGSVEHPMTEQHYIQWVYILTEHGGQRKSFSPDDKPKVTFALSDDKAIAAFAYCNLHGLWKTDIE